MIAVRYHTILESQNIIWPMSHTSRTCGCRRQNFLHDMSGGEEGAGAKGNPKPAPEEDMG